MSLKIVSEAFSKNHEMRMSANHPIVLKNPPLRSALARA
jgi:hypothetical protein